MAEITGVLLAAGCASRFGGNKLLAEIEYRALILHSMLSLSPCDRIIAVVRTDDEALQSSLHTNGIDCVLNPQPERGMGYSIACAVAASTGSSGWCMLPADMPYISTSTTQQIVNALRAGAAVAAPYYHGRRGHPVAFSHQFHDALSALDGDTGARDILRQYADRVTAIVTEDAGVLVDVDTPADLQQQRTVNKQ